MSTEILESLIDAHYPAAARGDRAAYGRIVVGCQSTVTSIALAIVRDVPTSEDIAQEAFLSAWQNLRKLHNPASFLPWLRQITRNLARDHLRGRKPESGADFDVVLATVADPTPDHADQLARQQEEAIVADLIDDLPEETREILLIYYREGQSSRQVADLLGLQDAAVRKRLSRARQSLRQDLIDRLGEFARATAPTAAFTALVVAGLTMSAPAAAAGLGAGAAAASHGFGKFFVGAGAALARFLPKLGLGGAAGSGASRLMLGVGGGVILAVVITIAGLFIGLRRYWVTAIDRQERIDLAVFALAGVGVVTAFTAAMMAAVHTMSATVPMLAFLGLILALGLMNILWLPRILERRHAIEARSNPALAERSRRAERRNAWLGMAIGLVLGAIGLGYGLAGSGRI